MKKILLLIALIYPVMLFSQPASGDGSSGSPYSGLITTPWTLNGDYYCGDLSVTAGTFTISAGSTLRFGTGNNLTISGTGVLSAVGNSTNFITFTSSSTTWGHIYFNAPSEANQSLIDYCIIENGNVKNLSGSSGYGGGIHADFSNLTISNSVFRYNKAEWGGGIFINKAETPTISRCLFLENESDNGGGGIYCWDNTGSTIINSIFDGNIAGYGTTNTYYTGGGVALQTNTGIQSDQIINCTFVNNDSNHNGDAIQFYGSGTKKVTNCIFWGSTSQVVGGSSTNLINCAIQGSTTGSNTVNLNSSSSAPDGPHFKATDGSDWSIKVISPCRDAGTTPSPTVPTDYSGNSRVRTYDIGAYEVQYNYWLTGAGSADWNTAGNWNGGVPTSSQNVVIASGATNYPTGSTSLDYTIGSGYGLVLEPGAKATFNTLTKTGDLKLMSNASGISSLITNNSVSAIVELFLTGGGTITTYKWHYISTPVSTLPVTTFTGVTLDVVGFAEPRVTTDLAQGWVGWDGYVYSGGGTDLNYDFTDLTPGKGYDYWDQLDQKFTFSGSLNVTNQALLLSYSGTANSGFNLLGNPFSSGLNWNAILSSGTYPYPANTSQGIYFTRNKTQCTYIGGVGIPSDVTGIVPPMQGFFVKTSSTGNTINLDPAARTQTNIHSRYKGDEVIPLVRLSLSEDTFTDETVVRFDTKAKIDLDYEFDATKIFFSTSDVGIYSEMGGTKYAINGQPFPDPMVEIPIVVNLTKDGVHVLTSTQLQGLDDYNVFLTDNTTGFTANLKTTPAVTFSASTGLITDRFILKVGNITTQIENPITTPDNIFNVYSGNNNINIQTISDDWDGKSGSVRVLDLTGKTASDIQNVEFSKNSLVQIQSPGATGIYIVEVRSGVKRFVGKVVIK